MEEHQTDIWGYYCETDCKRCAKELTYCPRCEGHYGSWQWHDCEKAQAALDSKQLSFNFK